jgi:Animal haem peroxidase
MQHTEHLIYVSFPQSLISELINQAKFDNFSYGLSYEDIEKGLPLIDTSKTLIREVCPPFLANVECRAGKYRRYDGLCTNLEHPTWGATMTPFTRSVSFHTFISICRAASQRVIYSKSKLN